MERGFVDSLDCGVRLSESIIGVSTTASLALCPSTPETPLSAVLAEGPRRALLLDRVWGLRAVELEGRATQDRCFYLSISG